MENIVTQFIRSFINLFFLANFVVGSASYALLPGRVSSPVPEGALMLSLGIVTALITLITIFRGAQTA